MAYQEKPAPQDEEHRTPSRGSRAREAFVPIDDVTPRPQKDGAVCEVCGKDLCLLAVHSNVAVGPVSAKHKQPGGILALCFDSKPLRRFFQNPNLARTRRSCLFRSGLDFDLPRLKMRQQAHRSDPTGDLTPPFDQPDIWNGFGELIPVLHGVSTDSPEPGQGRLIPEANAPSQSKSGEEGSRIPVSSGDSRDPPKTLHAGEIASIQVPVEDRSTVPKGPHVFVPTTAWQIDQTDVRTSDVELHLRSWQIDRLSQSPVRAGRIAPLQEPREGRRRKHLVFPKRSSDPAVGRQGNSGENDESDRQPLPSSPAEQVQGNEGGHPHQTAFGERGR